MLLLSALGGCPCLAQPVAALEPSEAESAAPAGRAIPFRQDPAVEGSAIARTAIVLGFSLALVVIVALVVRRILVRRGLAAPSAPARIRTLEARTLGNKLSVVLIRVDDREYLVTQTPASLSCVPHLPEPEPPS